MPKKGEDLNGGLAYGKSNCVVAVGCRERVKVGGQGRGCGTCAARRAA